MLCCFLSNGTFINKCAPKPATSPQNAPPTPSKVTFAAVAKKVMSAVSRPIGFVKALARLLPIVPSNANPANVAMNVAGRIKTMQPMLPQKFRQLYKKCHKQYLQYNVFLNPHERPSPYRWLL